MKDLSVIIISYNTSSLTKKAINAIQKSLTVTPDIDYEIIVVDNASSDDSTAVLSEMNDIQLIKNSENLGFGAANNIGIKQAQGEDILLLNSDVIADSVNFRHLLSYMKENKNVGELTVRVELSNGKIDPASHRGFPTIWRSFCYYTKLEKIFGKIPFVNRLCGGYHLTYMDISQTHEIDSPTAAFLLTRKKILDDINGFDETFFMYGEDLDLSYRIKEKGYTVVYHPVATVLHLKHQSGLKTKTDTVQQETQKHFYHAMKIFYDKHYASRQPFFINSLIHLAIDLKSRT